MPTSAHAAAALPGPQQRSQGIAVRRGIVLVLMSLLIPGSAQVAAGNKRLGRIALRIWLGLIALLVLVVIAALVARDADLAERLVREHTLGLAAHVEKHGRFPS